MKIYKAYKFRMYPTKNQSQVLNSYLGASRFIYNNYLTKKEEYKKAKKPFSLTDMKKDIETFKHQHLWLEEIDNCIIRTTLENLENNYQRYYNNQSVAPRYKNKDVKESYKTINTTIIDKGIKTMSIKIDLNKKVIKLPKIDEIKIKGYHKMKNFQSKIFSATISKEAGRYYVSLCVEEEITNKKIVPQSIIGIDLGIKDLIICSDGIKYPKIKGIEVQERRIEGLQKALSRCTKGSNNSKKIKQKIARAYQKIKNIRKYYIHKITTKLVKENDIIVTETLTTKKMMMKGKHYLAKYIGNASFQEIIRQLSYKTKWKFKKFYQVNAHYPSSQICCHCGKKEEKVKKLDIREWHCSRCGFTNDRDINASINIMDKGFEMYLKEQYGI